MGLVEDFARDGFVVFAPTPKVQTWAHAARAAAKPILADPKMRAAWLRHQKTWFVGVDVLLNDQNGAVNGTDLIGPWQALIPPTPHWHPAQISAVYPGYPGRDPDESEAAHRFRKQRFAAHVDGLLPEGPARRRFLREPHAFVLGIALDDVQASPLMVWPGSHRIIGAGLRAFIGTRAPDAVDLTEAYADIRRQVFDTLQPEPVNMAFGGAVLLHRHMLHGVSPWVKDVTGPRVVAYFRPQFAEMSDWLAEP